ncbi:MAG: GAF domain-containing protein [Candidatus Pacebacteria bacterium]|nr:GAF domain-containing protein [Candidatus Paceibacterota bacterium]
MRSLEVERCIIYAYDQQTDSLKTLAMAGNVSEGFSLAKDRGSVGHAFCTGNTVAMRSPYEDRRFDKGVDQLRHSVTRNLLCVPAAVGKERLGCVEVANKKGLGFVEGDMRLVELIAKEIAAGLKREIVRKKQVPDRIASA